MEPVNGTHNSLLPNDSVSSESVYSYGERVFLASIYTLIATCGLLGNFIMILCVMLSRKLWTPTNIFVTNLCIADLLSCLAITWSIIQLVSNVDTGLISRKEWLCTVGGFITFACKGASLYIMAVIALNRYVLISRSIPTYKRLFSPTRVVIMIAAMWLFPLCLAISWPIADMTGFGHIEQVHSCSEFFAHPKAQTFKLLQIVFFYPIPCTTITVSYTKVFILIKTHFSEQKRSVINSFHMASAESSSSEHSHQIPNSVPNSTLSAHHRLKRIRKTEIEITKNMCLVVLLFFLFFTPHFIFRFIPEFKSVLLYTRVIVLLSSAINPLIYARRHPQFKLVCGMLIRLKLDQIPEPSGLLKQWRRCTSS